MDVEIGEVLAELDEVGTALFEAATRRAIARKNATTITALQAKVAELETPTEGASEGGPGVGGGPQPSS